jgi:hypothetical protein
MRRLALLVTAALAFAPSWRDVSERTWQAELAARMLAPSSDEAVTRSSPAVKSDSPTKAKRPQPVAVRTATTTLSPAPGGLRGQIDDALAPWRFTILHLADAPRGPPTSG